MSEKKGIAVKAPPATKEPAKEETPVEQPVLYQKQEIVETVFVSPQAPSFKFFYDKLDEDGKKQPYEVRFSNGQYKPVNEEELKLMTAQLQKSPGLQRWVQQVESKTVEMIEVKSAPSGTTMKGAVTSDAGEILKQQAAQMQAAGTPDLKIQTGSDN